MSLVPTCCRGTGKVWDLKRGDFKHCECMMTIGSDTAEDIAATIAERCTKLREERDFSLQDVADRSGLSKSHVWDLEQGRSRNPTVGTAVRLARAFGVSIDYLIGIGTAQPDLHPEALRIACEVDGLLRRKSKRT